MSPSCALAATALTAAANSGANSTRGPLNAFGEPLRGHAGNGLFARRIDGQDDHRVGVCECTTELIQKVKSARVPVRLKDNVNAPAAALARRG